MLQSLTRILHGSLVQTDTEMAKKYIYIHLYSPFLVEIRQTTTIGKFVFGRYGAGCVSINGLGDPDLWPFDLETDMRIALKVGNLPSKCGHARPLGSRIICYVHDGWRDGRTKATLIAPFPKNTENRYKWRSRTDVADRTELVHWVEGGNSRPHAWLTVWWLVTIRTLHWGRSSYWWHILASAGRSERNNAVLRGGGERPAKSRCQPVLFSFQKQFLFHQL